MSQKTVLIDFKADTPVNLDDLPEGLTREEATEIRAVVVRLRSQGLHVLFAAVRGDKAFQFASGDARVLRDVAGDTAVNLNRLVKSKAP